MSELFKDNRWFFLPFMIGWVVLFALRIFLDKGQLLMEISEYRTLPRNQFFMIATRLGEVVAFLSIAIVFLFRSYLSSLAIGICGLSVLLISNLLKGLFKYERPLLYFRNIGLEHDFPKIEGLEPYVGLTSFPSGHTMGAFALMALASFYLEHRWLKFLLFVLACLVAFSRIYLGHHFLEDIIFGSIIGLLIAIAIFRFMKRIKNPILQRSLSILGNSKKT